MRPNTRLSTLTDDYFTARLAAEQREKDQKALTVELLGTLLYVAVVLLCVAVFVRWL